MDNQKTSDIRKGAAYIRVSTEEQTELSPDAQKRLILDYAEKNGISVSGEAVFMENGISGKYAKKRPEFQRMIGLAKSPSHPFDVILVWKFSRFARNQEESIVYKSMLKKDRVEVISVSEPLTAGPFGTLIERIIEWMDEYYSIRLSGEVLRGMTEHALRGGYQASPPLGYRAEGGGRPPSVVPEEAAAVRMIFECCLKGMEPSAIARKLNQLGVRTKRGRCFETRTVRYILSNPFYMGKVRWTPRQEAAAGTKSGDGTGNAIIADGTHVPLVSKEEFSEAGIRLKKRLEHSRLIRPAVPVPASTAGSDLRPLPQSRHYLSGLFRCPICGASLSYNRASGSFQCWRYTKGFHSGSVSISARKAESALLLSLDQLPSCQEPLIRFCEKQDERKLCRLTLEKELKQQAHQELRTREAYEHGIDTLEEYRRHKARLCARRAQLEDQLERITAAPFAPQTPTSPLSDIRSVRQLIASPKVPAELKGTALRAVLQKIVFEKETGEYHFYYDL